MIPVMCRSRYFSWGGGGGGGGEWCPTENAPVLLYDTLISVDVSRLQEKLTFPVLTTKITPHSESFVILFVFIYLFFFYILYLIIFIFTIYVKPLFLPYNCCKEMLLPVLMLPEDRPPY